MVRLSRWVRLGRKVGLGPCSSDMAFLKRLLRALPLLLLSPFLLRRELSGAGRGAALPQPPSAARRRRLRVPDAASVVIPNWNGRDLLEKYLPSRGRRAGRQSRE